MQDALECVKRGGRIGVVACGRSLALMSAGKILVDPIPAGGLVAMAVEFNVTLEDKPGTLARLAQTLGDARVNIEAVHGVSREGQSFVAFLPRDPDQAARLLDEARVRYTRREVLIVRVLDEPGMLAQVALVLATAGINIDSIYVTTRGHLVLGVDDLDGAIHVASGMAVMEFD